MRRYIARESFMVPLKNGTNYQVAYGVWTDGLPGVPELPAEILKRKDLLAKFIVVDIDTGEVEKATAAPGEKRAVKRPVKRTKKPA